MQTVTETVDCLDWQTCWRTGFAPHLSTRGLLRLWVALASDSPDLLQGATTTPPPLQAVATWPAEQTCPVGTCGLGDGLETVEQIHDYFGRICNQANATLQQAGACRYFLNWYDQSPREEVVPLLLAEVEAELRKRREA